MISDTEAEEQTGGGEESVSGVEEDDEKAAERARVLPGLTISEFATGFSQHFAFAWHGVEWMFGVNEWPAIMKFYEALRKHLFQRDVGVTAAVQKLWSDTQKKVHASFPPQLFRTTEYRLGNAIERLYYNVIRHYSADVVQSDDLVKLTKKIKVQCWLEEDQDYHVTNYDIWHRICCGLDDLGNLQYAMIALVGQESAVEVAHGLVSAFMVMQFIGFYAVLAVADLQPPDSLRLVHHFELVNGGILSVAEFARIHGDWNFLMKSACFLR